MTPTIRRRFPNPRRALTEVRETLGYLARIAAVFLLVFLAGALVGTFAAGCQTVYSLAPR